MLVVFSVAGRPELPVLLWFFMEILAPDFEAIVDYADSLIYSAEESHQLATLVKTESTTINKANYKYIIQLSIFILTEISLRQPTLSQNQIST